ncbi:MAG: 16S rRNA (cytosine(1402)-N(4))-methyltransferase RsmH [Candidatus Peribacteraceae bacterium]|nr:16S rRNA (cytosine(1402)-N(4))-methyltransferase RsmH [Candidatus Peribacteraceae bacterium]
MTATPRHRSVLGENSGSLSVFDILQPQPGDAVLDATLGLGGHAEGFLRATVPDGRLFGVDADERNLDVARKRLEPFGDRCTFIKGNFRDIASCGLPPLDVIFADLGVSSPHFDDPERGFTFRDDAPLDMRYDRSKGETASELIAKASEEDLKHVFRSYGELQDAGRLARAVYGTARHAGIARTADVRKVVETLFGYKADAMLPQVFQALRIWTNDELGALEQFLRDASGMLASGGRIGVISYHSLEDRMAKQAFRSLTTVTKDVLTGAPVGPATFELLTKKPVVPSQHEQSENPRSRSAKFRAMKRLSRS